MPLRFPFRRRRAIRPPGDAEASSRLDGGVDLSSYPPAPEPYFPEWPPPTACRAKAPNVWHWEQQPDDWPFWTAAKAIITKRPPTNRQKALIGAAGTRLHFSHEACDWYWHPDHLPAASDYARLKELDDRLRDETEELRDEDGEIDWEHPLSDKIGELLLYLELASRLARDRAEGKTITWRPQYCPAESVHHAQEGVYVIRGWFDGLPQSAYVGQSQNIRNDYFTQREDGTVGDEFPTLIAIHLPGSDQRQREDLQGKMVAAHANCDVLTNSAGQDPAHPPCPPPCPLLLPWLKPADLIPVEKHEKELCAHLPGMKGGRR